MKKWAAILMILVSWAVSGQVPATVSPAVSLVTCGPGLDIYELEGHTALLLRSGAADVLVNWGVFDFNSPNFVYRFVKGETDYRCAASPYDWFVGSYRREGRWVEEQLLDLSPEQAERVVALTLDNLRPENAVYRYNYVLDNCATRPLGILMQACGDSLLLSPPEVATTFRDEMRRFHRDYPWYQFGIDLALGAGIDRPISPLERAFAPVTLMDIVATGRLLNPDGSTRPLVKETVRVVEGHAVPTPTPWPLTPMAVAIYLAVATVAVSAADWRRKRLSRWFDSALYGVFGLASLVITFLIFVSVHEATAPNWLYLWLNPLCFVPAMGVWLKRYNIAVYSYQIVNFALLTLLLAGHHFIGQSLNPAFPLLILCDMARAATYIYLYKCSKKNHVSDSARPRS